MLCNSGSNLLMSWFKHEVVAERMLRQASAMQQVVMPAVTFCCALPQFDTLFTGPDSNSLTVVTTSDAVTADWRVLDQAQLWCCD